MDPPYLNTAPVTTDFDGNKHTTAEAVEKLDSESEEVLLLSAWNGKLLAESLNLPGLEIEIDRAVEQVERDMRKGKDLKKQRDSADNASAAQTQNVDEKK